MDAVPPIIWSILATVIGLAIGLVLRRQSPRDSGTLTALHERLGRIDAAQSRIEQLSGDVLSLQDILSNKQARGAFGEVQLHSIVTRALPPDAVTFQATLSNGRRPDCIIHLPDAPLVIDAKFPLESYEALVAAPSNSTRKAFRDAVELHIQAIAARYLIPGETAENALMFLPSEAVFAELHANHTETIRKGFDASVFIVSPTTCMATLNTMRAILKDHRLRQSARELRGQLGLLTNDVDLIARRTAALTRHLDQSRRDLDGLTTATSRLTARTERIDALDFAPPPATTETRPRIIHRA